MKDEAIQLNYCELFFNYIHKIDCKILTFNPNINDENVRVIEKY